MLDLFLGLLVALFNFSGFLRHGVEKWLPPPSELGAFLLGLSRLPARLLPNAEDVLYRSMLVGFIGVWIFFGLLAVLAVTRSQVRLFLAGLFGAAIGVSIVSLLSWAAMLLTMLVRLLIVIFRFLAHALLLIFDFLGAALHYLLPVLAIAAACAIIFYVWKNFPWKIVLATLGGIAALLALLPVFRSLWVNIIEPLARWVAGLLRVVVQWIGRVLHFLFGWLGDLLRFVLGWVAVILLVLIKALVALAVVVSLISLFVGVLGSLGHLLAEQLRSAWQTGRSRKGLLCGSFSFGASLSLILLVASGVPRAQGTNLQPVSVSPTKAAATPLRSKAKAKKAKRKSPKRAVPPAVVKLVPPPPPPQPIGVVIDQAFRKASGVSSPTGPFAIFLATLPSSVKSWAAGAFQAASAPAADALVLALTIAITAISVLFGIFASAELEYSVRFHNSDLLTLAALPIALVVYLVAASEDNQ